MCELIRIADKYSDALKRIKQLKDEVLRLELNIDKIRLYAIFNDRKDIVKLLEEL